jgi:muramidase (phage lysozyme)
MIINTNRKAFLDMIAHSEGTYGKGDNGYNVIVGGKLFNNGYADHPRIVVEMPRLKIKSSAAGRYQLLARYFDVYKKQLKLKDFGHASQDAIAIQQIKECRALHDIDAGNIKDAIAKCACIWASLPGAGYGQRENKVADLVAAYASAGGVLA